jgi:hypothetical protein
VVQVWIFRPGNPRTRRMPHPETAASAWAGRAFNPGNPPTFRERGFPEAGFSFAHVLANSPRHLSSPSERPCCCRFGF